MCVATRQDSVVEAIRTISAERLADFHSMTLGDVYGAFYFLSSVVEVPAYPHEPIKILDREFIAFIQDQERCTDEAFFVDIPAHEDFLALRCLKMMNAGMSYARSCWDPQTTAEIDEGLIWRLHYELLYARALWQSHIKRVAEIRGNLSDELVHELITMLGDLEEHLMLDIHSIDVTDISEVHSLVV